MTASESVMAPFTIRLFGPLQVFVQGQPLPRLRSQKALWLLALLALRSEAPVQREWAARLLWPDSGQERAFSNLRVVLSELRRALDGEGERLQASARTLLLNLAGADADIVVFDAGVKSKDPAALERAVARYQGPLLEGCNEEWVPQERRIREQHCVGALETLADAALASQRYAAAAGYYQRAIKIDPWRESAQRGVMETLARSGDRNAALQAYRDFLGVLRSDPAAVPDALTTALYQRLRAEARRGADAAATRPVSEPPPPAVGGHLPYSLTEMVGREDERSEVAAALRRSRLVTLTGPGGIGKTRLAGDVAAESVAEHADGAWLVALEAITDGGLVTAQIASALGVKEKAGQTLLQCVTERMRAKRLLLVLDNCEHLLEASAQAVGHLLRHCAHVRILATSREALGITGEVVWTVPALAVPDPKHLPQTRATLLRVLMGYEGVQLFVERAKSAQKTFLLTGENALAIARICAHLEGIPLAIELAAARVSAMTVEQLAERLQEHLGLLAGGSRIAMSRQQTLRAALDWSHVLLSQQEQIVFRRLGVFTGGWSLEAAEFVCEGEGIAASEILNLLASLAAKSLVLFAQSESDEGGRYRFLEIVRQYAAERFAASIEAEEVQRRHQDWFLAFAEQAEPYLTGAEQKAWLRRLEADHDNLRAALASNGQGQRETELRLRLAGALWRFWDLRGDYNEGRACLSRALEHKDSLARTASHAKSLHGAGVLANSQSDYPAARKFLDGSLEIYRELEDRAGIANALHGLGNAAFVQADYAVARALYTESLEIRRNLADNRGIASSLNNLAKAAHAQGENAVARKRYEESLEIRRRLLDTWGIADSLKGLGYMIGEEGDYLLAQTLLTESALIFRDLQDQENLSWALIGLTHVAYEQGDYVTAGSLQEECLLIFQKLGARRGEAWALHLSGDIACQQGNYIGARTFYNECLVLFREIGEKHGIAEALGGMGNVLLARHQAQKAVCLWAVSDNLRANLGSPLTAEEQARHARQMAQARSLLGEDSFAAAWSEGSDLTEEQAIDYALENK